MLTFILGYVYLSIYDNFYPIVVSFLCILFFGTMNIWKNTEILVDKQTWHWKWKTRKNDLGYAKKNKEWMDKPRIKSQKLEN